MNPQLIYILSKQLTKKVQDRNVQFYVPYNQPNNSNELILSLFNYIVDALGKLNE